MKLLLRVIFLSLVLLVSPVALGQTTLEPNDPEFGESWALEQIGAQCAWQHTTGNGDVIVAVVDSGVDLGHPDLVDRLHPAGRDFVDGDDDPSDENGHGTNVAGIIAATLNNSEGIVGLAPGITILPVRVMDAKGYGSDRAIARGVRYAVDQGSKVINLSLGATLTIGAETESELVSEAIRYAQTKGALVVVAAGNDFVPLPNAIVGDNPDVLVVAATDENDVKADFSNSGPWISVAAPGVHILSTMPTYEVYLTSDALPRDERFRQNYDYMSGTSQATPFVSALAALLFSKHPDWDASQVFQEIRNYAADISQQNPELVAEGYLGSGRINACESMGGLLEPIDPETPADTPGGPVPAPSLFNSDVLIILGVLLCGGVLLLGLMLFALVRALRRPAPAPAAVPVYAPPAAAPAGPFRAPPGPAAPAPTDGPQTGGWGGLAVIAGPVTPRLYPLAGAELVIGRDPGCAVVLIGDGTVSRRHAVVRNDGHQVTIEDAGSTHGTYLGGRRISGPTQVRRGDVIQIGQTLLRFD